METQLGGPVRLSPMNLAGRAIEAKLTQRSETIRQSRWLALDRRAAAMLTVC